MKNQQSGGRVLWLLSSLRLAVVTMVTLGATCAYATFYEMRHGTPAVQRDIYHTWWFAAILGLLGLNVFSVMVSRYPWTKHHIGFLTAHVGILAVLAGSVVSLYRGLDSNMALYEGETSNRVMLLEKALHVSVPGGAAPAIFPVAFEKRPPQPGNGQRFAVPGADGLTLVAEDYHPHVAVTESFAPAASGPPAAHFSLQAPMATQDGWLVASDPEHARVDFGMVSLDIRAAATEAEGARMLTGTDGPSHLSLVAFPDGRLRYVASDANGALRTGVVAPGQPVATGWAALGLTVDRFLPESSVVRTVTPQTPPAKEEKRQPAVRLHLESARGRSDSEWLLWGEERAFSVVGQPVRVAWRAPEVSLPFRVSLLRFSDDPYPGSRMASTYESTVRVDDPEQGTFEALISMNHPLHYRGYIFFQSSFVEGRPMMSIFSVARAPGLPLVYTGVVLIGVGIVWMFYVKPQLAKRQAAAALAAHRARENPNEANAPGPVRPRPGEPAPAPRGA
jgi:hypothetical protein